MTLARNGTTRTAALTSSSDRAPPHTRIEARELPARALLRPQVQEATRRPIGKCRGPPGCAYPALLCALRARSKARSSLLRKRKLKAPASASASLQLEVVCFANRKGTPPSGGESKATPATLHLARDTAHPRTAKLSISILPKISRKILASKP